MFPGVPCCEGEAIGVQALVVRVAELEESHARITVRYGSGCFSIDSDLITLEERNFKGQATQGKCTAHVGTRHE